MGPLDTKPGVQEVRGLPSQTPFLITIAASYKGSGPLSKLWFRVLFKLIKMSI